MKETERRSALLRPFFLSRSLLEKPLSFSLIPSTRAAIAIFSLQFSAPASLPSTTRRKIFPLYSSVFPPLFSTPAREKSCILCGRENLRVKNPNEKEARPFPLLQFLFLPAHVSGHAAYLLSCGHALFYHILSCLAHSYHSPYVLPA